MRIWLVLFAVATALGGCASTPSEKSSDGQMHAGYIGTKLAEDRYQVSFFGKGRMDSTTVEDLALMRAAELCQAAGYDQVKIYSQSVSVDEAFGLKRNNGEAEVKCSHDVGTDTQPAADIIARVRAVYPDAMPKS